jgi:hypothetical protein
MPRLSFTRSTTIGLLAAGVALLAGCSSSPAPSSSTSTTAATTTTTTPPTGTTGSSTTTTSATGVSNLSVTDELRSELLDAGAAHANLPPSDFTGLQPGTTYYAFDASTSTYWAAAGLVPSSSSTDAQVASQDDGSYLLFTSPKNGTWTVYSDGLGGRGGTPCPVAIPVGVLQAWGWASGTCQPPST